MPTYTVTVPQQCGIHMRPAARVAQQAQEVPYPVTLQTSDGKTADARSIIEISTLGTCSGQSVTVICEDAQTAEKIGRVLAESCVKLSDFDAVENQ